MLIRQTFQVGLTYCDGVNFTHRHEELADALHEYSDMLGHAIEPQVSKSEAKKHLRLVTLICFDDAGEIVHHIYSCIFQCEHNPTREEVTQ